MTGIYSPLKVLHHEDRLQAMRQGRQPDPLYVHLVISDLCNQSCQWCAYRQDGYTSNQLFTQGATLASYGHNNPRRQIPYAKVREILDDCQALGVKAILLTGGGEPTAHPQFRQILLDIQERDIDLAVTTNGVLLNETDMEILSTASWVRCSIDAGLAETYCRTRSVPETHWHRAWRNVQQLARLAVDAVVGVGFVVTRENHQEIFEAALLARDAGAHNIRFTAKLQNEGSRYYTQIYDTCRVQLLAARQLSRDGFQVFDNFGERLDDLVQASPDYTFCGHQQLVTYIGGDQNVYRCCMLAYNERGLLGSLQQQRFLDLWRSAEKQHALEHFDARGCQRCMFNTKNRTILYALDPQPPHVNFL